MNRKLKLLVLASIAGASVSGCSLSDLVPKDTIAPASSAAAATAASVHSQTHPFQQVLESHQNELVKGNLLSKLPQSYQPQSSLRHYAFSTIDGNLAYLYDTPDQETTVVLLHSNLEVQKILHFPNVQLNHAIVNNRILYFDAGDSAIKVNLASGDHSTVSLNEMKLVEDQLKMPNLNAGDVPLLQKEGYVFTNQGTVFDSKQQEYVPSFDKPGSAFPHAEAGDRGLLYAIDPRADGSVTLTWYQAEAGKALTGQSVLFRLDLQPNTPMNQLEYTLDSKGDLYVFAIGDVENGQPEVKAFKIPLGMYRSQSSDQS